MDFKILLELLLIGHFFGDFYFQSETLAKRKGESTKAMLGHGLLYTLSIALVLLPIFLSCNFKGFGCLEVAGVPHFLIYPIFLSSGLSGFGWLVVAGVPLTHFLIDLSKNKGPKWDRFFTGRRSHVSSFFVDQTAHLVILVVVAYICATYLSVAPFRIAPYLADLLTNINIGLSSGDLLKLLCIFLLLGKPTNIVIQKLISSKSKTGNKDNNPESSDLRAGGYVGLFGSYHTIILTNFFGQYNDKTEKKDDNLETSDLRAGRYIGLFERYLTVILTILGQYSALGFIVAAKSIARFNKIAEEQDFAEKYLLGTLSSILLAILMGILYVYIP